MPCAKRKIIWSPYILISWGWLWAVPKIWHWRINPCCGTFRIQGTQKYERTPRSNSILVNYLCYLSINLFIYYMQTVLTVRAGRKCSLTYHSEMILPLSAPFLYTLGGKWPIWWRRVWQVHGYFFLMGRLQYLEDKKQTDCFLLQKDKWMGLKRESERERGRERETRHFHPYGWLR